MASIQTSRDHETDEQATLMQIMFDKCPVGLVLLDQNKVNLANPVAQQLLKLDSAKLDQDLRIDGPDGLLVELLEEATRTNNFQSFDYRMPDTDGQAQSTLRFQVVPLATDKLLVRIDDVTAEREVQERWEVAVSNAFHELKTPLAVFTLGLSNLSTYYPRFSDEQRRSMINDLAEESDEMSKILSKLFGEMRNIQHGS